MSVTQAQLYEAILKTVPNMTADAAKQTASDWAKNPGKMYQDNNNTGFLNTLATFVLDMIRVQDFYNPLENAGVIRRSSQPFGNIQRLYAPEIPAVDADFQKEWTNGESSDMWQKRAVYPTQKFAYSNISYNNKVSVPGTMFYTSAFKDYGDLVQWETALTNGLLTNFSKWRFALFMDLIGRQATNATLKDTQTIQVSFADPSAPTIAELANLCKAIEKMEDYARIYSKDFNEDGFGYSVPTENIKYLATIEFIEGARYALTQGTSEGFSINPDRINRILDKFIPVPYIGVPTYYTDSTKATQLYPVYNSSGMVTGLAESEGATESTVQLDAAYVEGDADTVVIAIDSNRLNYITAVSAEGRSTELDMSYTLYNTEGDYRNLYARVLGNPSEGSGARLFADTSYLYVRFANTTQA